MPRILRSQGITKLFRPATLVPPLPGPLTSRLVAVSAARRAVGRYPSDGWSPWLTVCNDEIVASDDFNRPNATPPSANWSLLSSSAFGVSGNLPLVSHRIQAESGDYLGSCWNALRFIDSEISVTVADGLDAGFGGFLVTIALVSDPDDANLTGYLCDFHSNVPAGGVLLERIDPGTFVSLDSGTDTIKTGDTLTLRIAGATVTALINDVVVVTATDETYRNSGFATVTLSTDVGSHVYADNFLVTGPQPVGPRKTPLVGIRPPAVITCPEPPFPPPKSVLTTARPRPTTTVLRPPSVVTPAAVFTAPPIRVRTVSSRPRHTIGTVLRRPATLRVFTGPESWLTRIRPRPTTHVLRPAAVVLNPGNEQRIRTLRKALVRGRPGKTRTRLQPPTVITQPATFEGPRTALVRTRPVYPTYRNSRQPLVETDVIQLTIRVVEVRTRPRRTTTVLRVTIVPVAFTAPPPRVTLTRTRPRHTTARLSPPAVVAPQPLAAAPTSRLVSTRPRHTVYRLQRPTTLAVFPGPRSELTRVRPRPTTTVLVPAQIVRNPHVEQQLRTIRVRLVRARPQPTSTLLRPPAVVITTPQVTKIRSRLVAGRRPKTVTRFIRPATLEPYSVQLRERTLRVQLVRVRPRRTTLKLRPPTRVAVLTFSAGKPVLVRTRPQHTIADLRGPVVLRTFATGETRLVTTRPRHTTTVLRPPAVVRQPPAVTKIRSAQVTARPQPTTRALRPPAVLRVFTGPVSAVVRIRPRHTVARLYPPAVVTPFVAPAVAFLRSWLVRIRPPHTLTRLFPPRRLRNVPGEACLTDHAKFDSCLTDQAAADACLEDAEVATEACLTDQQAAVACLVDMSAATATLRDEE